MSSDKIKKIDKISEFHCTERPEKCKKKSVAFLMRLYYNQMNLAMKGMEDRKNPCDY